MLADFLFYLGIWGMGRLAYLNASDGRIPIVIVVIIVGWLFSATPDSMINAKVFREKKRYIWCELLYYIVVRGAYAVNCFL